MGLNHLEYKIGRPAAGTRFLQTDLILLYLLRGEADVRYREDVIHMKKEDILLVSSGMEYEIARVQDVICGTAVFPVSVLSQIMEKKDCMLYADSARDPRHSCQDLRDVFREMTREYILHTHQTSASMDSLMLRLLDCLIENHQLHQGNMAASDTDSDSRMYQIMQYIPSHIHEEISLTDLAEEMYVSASTLSRIFKKNTGVYFADYVMQLRVRSSLGLLAGSGQNLTQIAMNCGFSTSAAFNRSFKKVTGMLPSEYRKAHLALARQEAEKQEKEEIALRHELKEQGFQYNNEDIRKTLHLDLASFTPQSVRPVWCECINIGDVYEMSRANTQFHVLYLQEHLHFKYVRMWNIFSVKMQITDGRTSGLYNFDLLNQTLDFLVQHHLKPFLDLARRPDTAVHTDGSVVYYREEYIPFASRKAWEDMLSAFFSEIVRRYGQEEVSSWVFELCRDGFHKEEETRLYMDPDYDFWNVWQYTYGIVRDMVPGAMLGGISSDIDHDRDFTEDFYRKCVRNGCLPDFASFLLFPYEVQNGQNVPCFRQDREVLQVQKMKALLETCGLGGCRLFITEWNNSIGNRNYLNDSCFRSAYLVWCITRLWGQTDLMTIMAGTDWVSSYIDTNKILNGGIGLLTKDTICKPAFYAFSFFRHMKGQFLSRGDNYLLTAKGHDELFLLCFHFSLPRPEHAADFDDVDLAGLWNMHFEDERILKLSFCIKAMAVPGEYVIKKRLLNAQSGSVLDEWKKLGFETRLNREDVKYLQSISVPRIEMERVHTGPQTELKFEISLQPQEVMLLHIYRQ